MNPLNKVYTHFHLFCGLGGGAKGFNKGTARVGNMTASFRCIGGVDNDAASIRDFSRAAGVPGTLLDLFSLEQYVDFHGKLPPAGWQEAMPADIRRAAGNEFPNVVFLSAPCKGFSGLLPEASSKTVKYQALNKLTIRGVMLMLEAFADCLPELVIFENVPRIAKRGRHVLDQIVALLRAAGYAVSETVHDCGVIGGLGQSRKRFLLVARNEAKVPPFLYEPEKQRLRGVGEILGKFPLPGDPRGGPMHRVPALQWKTWVRLAFVEAGSDWRSLNKLEVADGVLKDFGIVPVGGWRDDIMGVVPWNESMGVVTGKAGATTGRFNVADPRGMSDPHNGSLGVKDWDDPAGTVTSNGRPASGSFSVADPRPPVESDRANYGVKGWEDTAGVVTGQRSPGQGPFSVADPRVDGHPKSVQLGVRSWENPTGVIKGDMSVGGGPYAIEDPRPAAGAGPRFSNIFRVVAWDKTSPSVTGGGGPTSGGLAVADPRSEGGFEGSGKYRVTDFDEPAGTVIASSTTGQGAFAVADPRPPKPSEELHGKFHVTPYDEPSRAVIGGRDNGAAVVADPRTTWSEDTHSNKLQVTEWEEEAKTVTGSRFGSGAGAVADPRIEEARNGALGVRDWDETTGTVQGESLPSNGTFAVADPRPGYGDGAHQNILSVNEWDEKSKTVTGARHVAGGALSVADPRPVGLNENRDNFKTGGHYGVVGWDDPSGAVPASAKNNNGPWSVADPRDNPGEPIIKLPAPEDRLIAVIRSLDGTWHRPFTTLELAGLQSLIDPDDIFSLDGASDSAHRERIGNAVPPDAAAAIAGVMGTTLLLAAAGETFVLSSVPIWVKPLAVALAVDHRGNIPDER